MSVAPLAGAWIEISMANQVLREISVAPLAGAWIEIQQQTAKTKRLSVAPLAGAWIEIVAKINGIKSPPCRSPRGSVD